MVRQAHHERNQHLTVRPEPFDYAQEGLVEGLNQRFIKALTCFIPMGADCRSQHLEKS